jgi:hypothetical protein
MKGRPLKNSPLPDKTSQRLRRQAAAWNRAMTRESEMHVSAELERAEVFRIGRPAREPVSVRLDLKDIFLLKRLARRQGISHSQLLAH